MTSEALARSILNSLSAHIAVLGCDGKIIAVNDAWRGFARRNGDPELRWTGVGNNYLEVCARANRDNVLTAGAVADALDEILTGSRTDFYCEYSCDSPEELRWFGMFATRLVGNVPGAVVAHENITPRKLAELALQRERDFSEELIDSAVIRVPWRVRHRVRDKPPLSLQGPASNYPQYWRAGHRARMPVRLFRFESRKGGFKR